MDFISETIPVRPLPGKKTPGMWRILRSIHTDLIGVWPEQAYRMKASLLKLGRYSLYIANSPETVEHVFVKNNQNYNRKSIFMRNALEPLLGDGLFISEGEIWQQRRDMEEPGFKPALLRKFALIMTECALECRQHWETQYAGKEILMLTEMASLTAEVLCRSLFGKHLGRHNAESIISGFSRYQAIVRHVDLATVLKLPDWLPRLPQNRKVLAMAARIHKVVDDIIAAQLNNSGEQHTLLAHMLGHYDPNDPGSVSLQQIRNEIVVLLMAGHETTANTLAWSWYLLAEHPRVVERLHEELDRVLARGVGQLVNEALDREGVERVVDRPPEAHRNAGVGHHVIHVHVGHGVGHLDGALHRAIRRFVVEGSVGVRHGRPDAERIILGIGVVGQQRKARNRNRIARRVVGEDVV